eukprot:m.109732 g.109732  ORF g.109732 m.109732 type:complete len:142 (-) comp51780_c0_seq2:2548-2973(-)
MRRRWILGDCPLLLLLKRVFEQRLQLFHAPHQKLILNAKSLELGLDLCEEVVEPILALAHPDGCNGLRLVLALAVVAFLVGSIDNNTTTQPQTSTTNKQQTSTVGSWSHHQHSCSTARAAQECSAASAQPFGQRRVDLPAR